MIISVRVVPNSKSESVQRVNETSYRIKIREKALEGRANIAVVEVIAARFKVRKADVSILSGLKSRDKKIGIADSAQKE